MSKNESWLFEIVIFIGFAVAAILFVLEIVK